MFPNHRCIQLLHQLYILLVSTMLVNLQTIRSLSMKTRVVISEGSRPRISQDISVLVMRVRLILVMMGNFLFLGMKKEGYFSMIGRLANSSELLTLISASVSDWNGIPVIPPLLRLVDGTAKSNFGKEDDIISVELLKIYHIFIE